MSDVTAISSLVKIVEVGPRDGLQSLTSSLLPTDVKREWIERLIQCGLTHIEVAAFVHPQKIPAMADADALCRTLSAQVYLNTLNLSALVPNQKGLDRAIAAGIKHVAIFTAASSAFTEKNIGMSVPQSLKVYNALVKESLNFGLTVRGYVSTIVACPYTGQVQPSVVVEVTQALLTMGCYEVSLGETLGVATPKDIEAVLAACFEAGIPFDRLALHPHNTYGTAIANVQKALEMGLRVFDSSAGGLGGCPFAPGAAGNVATEDILYLLEQQGYTTGVNLSAVIETSHWLKRKTTECGIPLYFSSQIMRAGLPASIG